MATAEAAKVEEVEGESGPEAGYEPSNRFSVARGLMHGLRPQEDECAQLWKGNAAGHVRLGDAGAAPMENRAHRVDLTKPLADTWTRVADKKTTSSGADAGQEALLRTQDRKFQQQRSNETAMRTLAMDGTSAQARDSSALRMASFNAQQSARIAAMEEHNTRAAYNLAASHAIDDVRAHVENLHGKVTFDRRQEYGATIVASKQKQVTEHTAAAKRAYQAITRTAPSKSFSMHPVDPHAVACAPTGGLLNDCIPTLHAAKACAEAALREVDQLGSGNDPRNLGRASNEKLQRPMAQLHEDATHLLELTSSCLASIQAPRAKVLPTNSYRAEPLFEAKAWTPAKSAGSNVVANTGIGSFQKRPHIYHPNGAQDGVQDWGVPRGAAGDGHRSVHVDVPWGVQPPVHPAPLGEPRVVKENRGWSLRLDNEATPGLRPGVQEGIGGPYSVREAPAPTAALHEASDHAYRGGRVYNGPLDHSISDMVADHTGNLAVSRHGARDGLSADQFYAPRGGVLYTSRPMASNSSLIAGLGSNTRSLDGDTGYRLPVAPVMLRGNSLEGPHTNVFYRQKDNRPGSMHTVPAPHITGAGATGYNPSIDLNPSPYRI